MVELRQHSSGLAKKERVARSGSVKGSNQVWMDWVTADPLNEGSRVGTFKPSERNFSASRIANEFPQDAGPVRISLHVKRSKGCDYEKRHAVERTSEKNQ